MCSTAGSRGCRTSRPPAGALFDSVSDRWGELFVFAGYVWFLHDSPWLLAVMAAIGGSMMVSYTRARAEGLGVELAGGVMQRAERIVLVAGGTLIAAWYGGDLDTLRPGRADPRRHDADLRRRLGGDRGPSLGRRLPRAVASRSATSARARCRPPSALRSRPPPSRRLSRVLIPPHVRKVAPLEQH